MAEENNPAPVVSDNPQGSVEQGTSQGSGTPTPEDNSGQSESQRKMQSERDKTRSENQSLAERMDQIEYERALELRDKAISTFLKENGKDYKDVDAEDLSSATSPEEIEATAKRIQAKADKIRNQALQDVQTVPEETMTAEEKAKALKDLEEVQVKSNKSQFGSFLSLQRKKVK